MVDDRKVPHAYTVCDTNVRQALTDELRRFDPPSLSNVSRPFSRDVIPPLERYVDELSRIDGGWDELLRRAMLPATMKANETVFALAWEGVADVVRRLRDLGAGSDAYSQPQTRQKHDGAPAGESLWREGRHWSEYHSFTNAIANFSPSYAMGVVSVIEDLPRKFELLIACWDKLESLLNMGPLDETRERTLRRLIHEAKRVHHELASNEANGCRLLVLWSKDISGYDEDEKLRAFLQTCDAAELERDLSQVTAKRTLQALLAAVGEMTAWVREGGPSALHPTATKRGSRKHNRSTNSGDAQVMIISAFTKHHQYANGSSLNAEPIGVNELAASAEVAKSTVSKFFKTEFKGHAAYKAMCRRDVNQLIASLKLLNREFSPQSLYGGLPANEVEGDEG